MSAIKTPGGLSAPGRQLWRAVTAAYSLRPDELLLLEKVCRTADDVARIETAVVGEPLTTLGSTGQVRAHPLLAELRGMRVVLAALLRQLDLPDVAADGSWRSATSERKRRAAESRWHRARSGRGDAASA